MVVFMCTAAFKKARAHAYVKVPPLYFLCAHGMHVHARAHTQHTHTCTHARTHAHTHTRTKGMERERKTMAVPQLIRQKVNREAGKRWTDKQTDMQTGR